MMQLVWEFDNPVEYSFDSSGRKARLKFGPPIVFENITIPDQNQINFNELI